MGTRSWGYQRGIKTKCHDSQGVFQQKEQAVAQCGCRRRQRQQGRRWSLLLTRNNNYLGRRERLLLIHGRRDQTFQPCLCEYKPKMECTSEEWAVREAIEINGFMHVLAPTPDTQHDVVFQHHRTSEASAALRSI